MQEETEDLQATNYFSLWSLEPVMIRTVALVGSCLDMQCVKRCGD